MDLFRGYTEILDDIVFRIAKTRDEIEKIAEFNEIIHGENLKNYILELYNNHPYQSYWMYLEKDNKILSSLALLENLWNISIKKIKVAEMGFVGTLIEYRGNGLYSVLNKYYEKLVRQMNISISTLRGIPNFYTKRGYCFALPSDMGYIFNNNDIKVPTVSSKIEFQILNRINSDDYLNIFKDQFVYTSPEILEYRYYNKSIKEYKGSSYSIIQNEKKIGFFTIGSVWDPNQIDIVCISDISKNILENILHFVKIKNVKSDKTIVYLTNNFTISHILDNMNCKYSKGWQWQSKIINLIQFIEEISDTINKRLSYSEFNNVNKIIKISDYKEIITINIIKGKISEVSIDKSFPTGKTDLKIPNSLLPKLLLADKSIDEINYMHPDCLFLDSSKNILDIMFPKLNSLPLIVY